MQKRVFLPGLILLLTVFLHHQGFSQKLNTAKLAKLDSFFNVLAAKNKTMGSFAIAQNGKIVYTRYIGYSRINDAGKTVINKNTQYDIGSVSKLFTAVMIYQLVDENKLSLNTTLDKFYPEIPNAKDITITDLLAHRSGLYDVSDDEADKTWETRPHTRKEILNKIIHGKTHFLPGTNELYNNTGYVLLAYILERITGRTYNENLQNRICKKIGLRNTYSPLTNILKKNEAESYMNVGNWEKITDLYSPNTTGADNVLSTPTDLIVFDEALFNGKLISENSLKAMKTFRNGYIGTGILRTHLFTNFAYGHDGDTYGIHSYVYYCPEDKFSYAGCINGLNYPRDSICVAILKICYDAPYQIPVFNTFPVSKEILSKYVGVYLNTKFDVKMTVTQQDTILLVKQSGQPYKYRLDAVKAGVFKISADDIMIEFDNIKNEMIVKQDGESYLLFKE